MSMTSGSSSSTAAGDINADETHQLIASDKVEGTDVRRSNGDRVGTIERVMINKRSGQVAYAVMSFGGFLGIGEERRAVPWNALRYNVELDAYELNVPDDVVRTAPAYRDDASFDWSDRGWNRSMSTHYGV